eukprot:797314-Alexandrium_andersonii.AAC.1
MCERSLFSLISGMPSTSAAALANQVKLLVRSQSCADEDRATAFAGPGGRRCGSRVVLTRIGSTKRPRRNWV